MNHLRLVFNRLFITYFCISILFLSAAFNASAADLKLAWNANSESDLAGYKIYYGTASGNYSVSKDVGALA